jgi:hypothetical protein
MMMDFYEDPDGTVYFTYRNGAISVLRPNDAVKKLETPFEALCGSWKSKGQLSILTDKGYFGSTIANSSLTRCQRRVLFTGCIMKTASIILVG